MAVAGGDQQRDVLHLGHADTVARPR
jgi:hypothetical protein